MNDSVGVTTGSKVGEGVGGWTNMAGVKVATRATGLGIGVEKGEGVTRKTELGE
jgi:hypothetical protein